MSVMSDFDLTLQEIHKAMSDQPAETQIEYRIDCLIRELDELVAMAADHEKRHLIVAQSLAIGQVYSRACLLQGFLVAAHAPTLKVIRNG